MEYTRSFAVVEAIALLGLFFWLRHLISKNPYKDFDNKDETRNDETSGREKTGGES
ncbi:hypothetical protein [Thiocapsa bogorovii]|uniref:hypothetical protein n=1 Tax=Thiocapsa bogorovii TaxID=521689 RepID=UPI001E3411FC|nr:hypothetical protein [Thiocapsa bogorovii]UHD18107.1 hypothetical protein LT988_08755 [Thiocapsa bogorovii]